MKDRTGVKDTCPLINEIISLIESSCSQENYIGYGEYKDAEAVLEDIRQMNSELRQLANEYIEKADDLEGEIKILNVEISILQDDKYELEQRIEKLEIEL